MQIEKSQKYAIIGTIIFSIIVLLILFLVNMTYTISKEEIGLEVEMDDVLAREGLFKPTDISVLDAAGGGAPADIPNTSDVPAEETLKTQQIEKSIAAAQAEKERLKKEERRIAKEQAEKAERTASLGRNAFASQGEQSGPGNESTGETGNGATQSGSGLSQGHSFDLIGRKSVSFPNPSYNVDDSGIVIVEILVDASGNVIQTDIRLRGTTTTNRTLYKAAEEAAKQARFSAAPGASVQKGTITYRFNLK